MRKPRAPQPPPQSQDYPGQPSVKHSVAAEPPRRPRGPPRKPLELPPIAGQVAVLLGFFVALYAVVAPRISGAEAEGANIAAREYDQYIERRMVKYRLDVLSEQMEADNLAQKDGKKKKSFAEKEIERNKRIRVTRKRLEEDFGVDAKRRAAANAIGGSDAKPWMLSLGVAGLILFSLGALLLMWQAPQRLSKVAYLIMLAIGLLVGGVGLHSPNAKITDASVKGSKIKLTLQPRGPIPLPDDHKQLSWGMSEREVKSKLKLESARSQRGLTVYKSEDDAFYGFRNQRLVSVSLRRWSETKLAGAFKDIPILCKTKFVTIRSGTKANTVMAQFGRAAAFAKATDQAARDMMREIRKVCRTFNKEKQ